MECLAVYTPHIIAGLRLPEPLPIVPPKRPTAQPTDTYQILGVSSPTQLNGLLVNRNPRRNCNRRAFRHWSESHRIVSRDRGERCIANMSTNAMKRFVCLGYPIKISAPAKGSPMVREVVNSAKVLRFDAPGLRIDRRAAHEWLGTHSSPRNVVVEERRERYAYPPCLYKYHNRMLKL